MDDKYQALRAALDALSAETEGRSGIPWFDSHQVLREEVAGEFDCELSPIPETDMIYIAAANPTAIQALLAERDALRHAAQMVLDGLNARIYQASKAREPVPVFDGIAVLHTALSK